MILLVDNYDSFTFNLAQALWRLGADLRVARNDALSVADVRRLEPSAIVLSPGPGRPEDARLTPLIVRHLAGRIPILGVCLGHQAIGLELGGSIQRVLPVHGKSSLVHHRGTDLFDDLPSPLVAGRYHSLALDAGLLPCELRITAWTTEGVVMAIAHRELPLWGVQFHPESLLTPAGPTLLGRFLALARERAQGPA